MLNDDVTDDDTNWSTKSLFTLAFNSLFPHNETAEVFSPFSGKIESKYTDTKTVHHR